MEIKRWHLTRRADDEIDGIAAIEIAAAKHPVDALRVAGEGAVRACKIGGHAQGPVVPAAAAGKLIGVGSVARAALPALASVRIEHRPALDEIGRAVARLDVGIGLPAPQRLLEMPILDMLAETLPQALDIEFEVGARAILNRAVQRRTIAMGFVIFDEWPVRSPGGRSDQGTAQR